MHLSDCDLDIAELNALRHKSLLPLFSSATSRLNGQFLIRPMIKNCNLSYKVYNRWKKDKVWQINKEQKWVIKFHNSINTWLFPHTQGPGC